MNKPEIIGWSISTNENGVEMATLPKTVLHEAIMYIEYLEKEVKNLNEKTETKPTRIPCEYPDCNCLVTCAWYERNEA